MAATKSTISDFHDSASCLCAKSGLRSFLAGVRGASCALDPRCGLGHQIREQEGGARVQALADLVSGRPNTLICRPKSRPSHALDQRARMEHTIGTIVEHRQERREAAPLTLSSFFPRLGQAAAMRQQVSCG